MKKDNLKLKSKELHFSLKSVDAKYALPVGEIDIWNLEADRIPRTHGHKLPDPPVVTKMVPCFPCTWG